MTGDVVLATDETLSSGGGLLNLGNTFGYPLGRCSEQIYDDIHISEALLPAFKSVSSQEASKPLGG